MRTYVESFPYRQLSSVETLKKLTGHVIQITAASSQLAVHRVRGLDLPGFQAVVRERIHESHQPSGGASADPATRLRQLTDMRQQGLIDDGEFEAKRRAVLDEL